MSVIGDEDRGRDPAAVEVGSFELASSVAEILHRHPVVGLAVGVVDAEGGAAQRFHGMADIASSTPVTSDTVFRIASITKTFTAVAVMQLWERGLIELDAPANDYLRAYRLIPASPASPPATVRHLLTHTAGLPEVLHPWSAVMPDFGESVRAGRPLPSLAAYYGGGLRLHADPGSRFVYTNHGPATLGQLVEDVTGDPLDRYLRDHVFEPLGMTGTDLSRSELIRSRLATGYELRSRGVKPVIERDMVTAGAASVYATPSHMARYLAALLGGGRNATGSVLQPETVGMMFEPHYRPDPRLPGMGLGFFRTNVEGRPAVGHQGSHPGFHSQILLAPDRGVGVMAFTNGARDADLWLPGETSALLGRLLGASDRPTLPPAPHRPELWDDLCGRYRLDARLTDVRLRAIIGAGASVFVRGGRLMLRFLTPIPALSRGLALQPDDPADPYVFRVELSETGLDSMRVVFGQDAGGTTSRLHFDLMPLTLIKQPPARSSKDWVRARLARSTIELVEEGPRPDGQG